MSPRRARRIAPRLRSGKSREALAHGIPEHIKAALKMIAASRNESVSWMLEQALVEYFGYDAPEYVERAATRPEDEQGPPAKRRPGKWTIK
jgi:predicted transcriptional regulator